MREIEIASEASNVVGAMCPNKAELYPAKKLVPQATDSIVIAALIFDWIFEEVYIEIISNY